MKITRIIGSLSLMAALLAAPFLVTPYSVYGQSMYPALNDHDLILVEIISLRIIPPRRGEVIAIRNPHKPETVDVKRIIGLPGETVEVLQRGVRVTSPAGVTQEFPEGTILGGVGDNGMIFTMHLGPYDYFVLGDNRRTSADSRTFGAIQSQDVIGRIILTVRK